MQTCTHARTHTHFLSLLPLHSIFPSPPIAGPGFVPSQLGPLSTYQIKKGAKYGRGEEGEGGGVWEGGGRGGGRKKRGVEYGRGEEGEGEEEEGGGVWEGGGRGGGWSMGGGRKGRGVEYGRGEEGEGGRSMGGGRKGEGRKERSGRDREMGEEEGGGGGTRSKVYLEQACINCGALQTKQNVT